MTEFLNDWGITLMVFLPLVGALIMMIVPADQEETHKFIALAATIATAVIGVMILTEFDYDNSGTLQFVVDRQWIELINARFILGLGGLSLPLLMLTLGIVPLVIIYSWDHIPSPGNPKAFFALMLTPLWPGWTRAWPWAIAGGVAVAAHSVLPGYWHVIAGGLAGSLAGAFAGARRR